MTEVLIVDGKQELKIYLPTRWNDLTCEQLLCICRLWQQELSEVAMKVQLLTALFDMKWWQWKRNKLIMSLDDHHIDQILNSVSIGDTEPDENGRVKQQWKLNGRFDFMFNETNLTKQLQPTLKIGWRTYHGPSDGLKNICIEEFSWAEQSFSLYHETKDPKHLATLAAILYRPRKWWPVADGDKRRAFNRYTFDARAVQMAKLPKEQLIAILMYYTGSRNAFIETYAKLFSDEPDLSAPKKVRGWAKVIMEMSGGIFGNLKQTQAARLGDVLLYMLSKHEDHEELKRKSKQR